MSGIVAGINAGIALTTMGVSMAQKKKAENNALAAQREADIALNEAKAKLDVNFQKGRTISKDPYTMALEQSLAQGASSVEAMQGAGVRGIAQLANLQQAQNQMGEQQRVGYGQELQQLDKDIRDEDSRLSDIKTQIDLQTSQDAAGAAAMYDEQAAAAKASMIQSGIDVAAAGASALPLYSQNKGAQKAAMAGLQFDANQAAKFGTSTGFTANPAGLQSSDGVIDFGSFGAPRGGNFSAVGNMGNREFRQFKRGLTPAQMNQIKFDPSYMEQYSALMGGND